MTFSEFLLANQEETESKWQFLYNHYPAVEVELNGGATYLLFSEQDEGYSCRVSKWSFPDFWSGGEVGPYPTMVELATHISGLL